MQQLSGLDASFLYLETSNAPMHVAGMAIYDQSSARGGHIGFKQLMNFYSERLHLARAFRERIVRVPFNLDHPYWIEDPNFDIEFHMRHIALPKPGDWRQLCILAARLHSRHLDATRPLWEAYVIEGLDNIPGLPAGSYAILTKIHHAAIDGVTGSEITAAIHDLEPNMKVAPPARPWVADREPTLTELMVRTNINNIRHPMRLSRTIARSVPAMRRALIQMRANKMEVPEALKRVPRTRFNVTVSAHRVFEGRSFSLDTIKAIRKQVDGATVNDVVLAVCGGALRKYLEAKEELPQESLVAMAPISVRNDQEKGAGGNQVAAMTVAIRTDIADPIERLQAVHEGTSRSKEMTNAIGARLMTDYAQFIPSSTAALAARTYTRMGLANRVRPFFNCVITNVPGPQVPLYSCGARLVTQFGLGPIQDGVGLIFPVFSYCGQLTIAITSCRDMLPDPAFFAECLEESFNDLAEAVKTKSTLAVETGEINWTNDPKLLRETPGNSRTGRSKTKRAAAKDVKVKKRPQAKAKTVRGPKKF